MRVQRHDVASARSAWQALYPIGRILIGKRLNRIIGVGDLSLFQLESAKVEPRDGLGRIALADGRLRFNGKRACGLRAWIFGRPMAENIFRTACPWPFCTCPCVPLTRSRRAPNLANGPESPVCEFLTDVSVRRLKGPE